MFKYIKWELKDVFSRNLVKLGIIGVVYLLTWLMIGGDVGSDGSVIYTLFGIIVFIAVFNAFYAGTKRTLETFESKTFLLESMIPMSPEQLLLGKYLMAIIVNVFYVFVAILGIAIAFSGNRDILDNLLEFIFGDVESLMSYLIKLSLYSIFFTSIVTLVFIFYKSLFPNGKFSKTIAYVVGYFAVYYVARIAIDMFDNFETGLYVVEILCIIASYFLTTALIKNKLEIYK